MSDLAKDSSAGHADVDAVLQSLAALDDLPVEEHVGVYEAAHSALRGALHDVRDTGDGSRQPA